MADENLEQWQAASPAVQTVTRAQSDDLLALARAAPRRRTHLLLHENHADAVQRLLVAFEHGTYIRPHRHTEQWEMIVPLCGTLGLLMFSPDGEVSQRFDIEAGQTDVAQVPVGRWHTLVAVTPSALMLEVKPGPYRPAEFAAWAPEEGDPRVAPVCRWLATAEVGARLTLP